MPDRHLYWVTLVTKNRDREERIFRFVFECALPTVAAFAQELREYGVVSGQRLRLMNDEDDNRVVREREDFLMGAGMVGSVQPYAHEVLAGEARGSDRSPALMRRLAGGPAANGGDTAREAKP